MLSLNGLNIGLWCGYGCIFMLQPMQPPSGCVAAWSGIMIITQGGDAYFGQRSPVQVVSNGAVYQVNRDCGGGIMQTATLGNPQMLQLAGSHYQCLSGSSTGLGTGNALCQILTLA